MGQTNHSRRNRFAYLASAAVLLFGGTAMAQTVRVFDDAPSIEQLRGIMIPESQPGSPGRSIIIQRPDTGSVPSSIQRASTQPLPVPRASVARENIQSGPVVKASVSEPPAPPAQARKHTAEPGAVAFRVNFAFDSAMLPDSAHEMMDLIAQLMTQSPEIKVRVEGHTDAMGAVDYNVSLSERRALSVGAYLAKHGIDPARLELIGKGMSEPLTPNGYDPANRRVQFVRIG